MRHDDNDITYSECSAPNWHQFKEMEQWNLGYKCSLKQGTAYVTYTQFTQLEVVAIVEFMYTLYSLTFQVRVNAGDSGLCCIRVSSL